MISPALALRWKAATRRAVEAAGGADCISEASEVAHLMAQALADGEVTPRERAQIEDAMADAKEAFRAFEMCGANAVTSTKARGR